MYLLDTNVVSEMRRGAKAHPGATAWLSAQPSDGFYISAITLLELELGTLLVERRDKAQGDILRRWLDAVVVPGFAERTLAVDHSVARRAAQMHVPDPAPELDALIAATAFVHNLVVVTRNERDFVGMGVPFINPWKP
jgi:predicted nucleic acid-binding protein